MIFEYLYKKSLNRNDLLMVYEKYHLKCLSTLYYNVFSRLVFQCSNNHYFTSSLLYLKCTNFNCPVCKEINDKDLLEIKHIQTSIIEKIEDKFKKQILSQIKLMKEEVFYNQKPIEMTQFDIDFIKNSLIILLKEFLKKFEHSDFNDNHIQYILDIFLDFTSEIFQLDFNRIYIPNPSILQRKITIKNKELILDNLNCLSIYDLRKYYENLSIINCSKFIIHSMQISVRTKPLIYYAVKQKMDNANITKYYDSAIFFFQLLDDSDLKKSCNAGLIAGSIYRIVSEDKITNAEYYRNFELTANDCTYQFQSMQNKIELFHKESNYFSWDDEKLKTYISLNKKYSPLIISFILNCSKQNLQEGETIIEKQKIKNESQLFKGNKFNLFAFDMSNLVNSYIELKKIKLNDNINPIINLKDYFKDNYQCWFFAQKHLEYLKKFYPENEFNHWYLEDLFKKKFEYQYVDVDATMAGIICSLIERHQNQIHTLYLGTGDKDVHIILDMAKKYKIRIVVIAINKDSLSRELRDNSNDIILLF